MGCFIFGSRCVYGFLRLAIWFRVAGDLCFVAFFCSALGLLGGRVIG